MSNSSNFPTKKSNNFPSIEASLSKPNISINLVFGLPSAINSDKGQIIIILVNKNRILNCLLYKRFKYCN